MEQENQVSSPSKKKLYLIIIGIIAILLVGWLSMKGVGPSITGVDVDRNINGSTTYSNDEGSVTVGGNKMPDDWPGDAPKYENASIQYSGSSNPQTGEAGSTVSFTTSDSAEIVVNFYKKELTSNGWTVEQTATMGASTILAAKKDTRTFAVYIIDSGNGQVSVTASVVIP